MEQDETRDALGDMRILRLPQVLQLIGVSRSTLYEMRKRGEFPQPDRVGARAVGWPRWVVTSWLEARPTASGSHRRP